MRPVVLYQSAALQLLRRIEEPLFVIDRTRSIAFQNDAAARMLRANVGIGVLKGRLAFAEPGHNRRLENAFGRLSRRSAEASPVCEGFRLADNRARRDWVVIVTALEPESHELAGRFAVYLIGRLRPRKIPQSLLADIFDLSRREIQVLELLLRGKTLRQIASSLSLSHETIRSNLKQIFRKAGVTSQLELNALMHRIAIFTPRHSGRTPETHSTAD